MVHVFDGAVDEHRVVVGNVNGNARGQVRLQLRDHGPHTRTQLQRVGRSLTNDPRRNGGPSIEANRRTLFSSTLFNSGHIPHLDGKAVDGLDHNVAELSGSNQVGIGADRELPLAAFYAACRYFQITAPQGVFGILGGELVGSQTVWVQPNAHGVLAFAENSHICSTCDSLQTGFDDAVDQFIDLQGVVRVAGKRQPNHRKRIGFYLGNDRLFDSLRQLVAHTGGTVAHLGSGSIGVFF